MGSIATGVRNTATGFSSLLSLTTGSNNAGFGADAGANITTGSNNIAIGNSTSLPSATASSQLNIGNIIFGTGLTGNVIGPAGLIGIGTTAPTAKLEIASEIANNSGLKFTSLTAASPTSTGQAIGVDASGNVVTIASGSVGWGLTGNSGTNPLTNYIGTSDNQSLVFKTNNVDRARFDTAGNFVFNKGASNPLLSSDFTILNTATGFATSEIKGGSTGGGALQKFTNDTGYQYFIGAGGSTNSSFANGSFVIRDQNTGLNKIVVSPNGNVGIGDFSGTNNSPTAKLEVDGVNTNTSGLKFTRLTAASPTSTGQALGVDSSGNVVTIAGGGGSCATCFVNGGNSFGGLTSLGTSDNNSLSLKTNNIEKLKILNTVNANNQILTISGGDALINGLTIGKGSNNSYGNTAIGESALAFNIQGYANTGVGFSALKSNLGSNHNTALGWQALQKVSSSGNNTAVGSGALYNNEGSSNTAIGKNSGQVITTGDNNTLIGYDSNFFGLTTGRANTFIGANIGGYSNSLSNNIIIADGDGNKRINVDAAGLIGMGTITPTNKLTVEDQTTTNVAKFNGSASTQCTIVTGTGLSCSSDARLKQGITGLGNATDIIKGLRPVTYQWNGGSENQYGFIAQDVQSILPDLVTTNSDGYLSLSKDEILPFVVKSIQETNARIDGLTPIGLDVVKSDIETLKTKVTNLEASSQNSSAQLTASTILTPTQKAILDLFEIDTLGNTIIKSNLKIKGNLEVTGNLKVGSDTAFTAKVLAGQTTLHVTFDSPMTKTPIISLTPNGIILPKYGIENKTINGFDIVISEAQTKDSVFDVIALESK
jgi:Chaperone of endosialidase